VTVALVTDARIRALNRAYRGIDKATDVLSFPAEPTWGRTSALPTSSPEGLPHMRTTSSPEGLPHMRTWGRALALHQRHLGDVVIARGVASRQARSARHPTSTELRILALHGLLHLLGYDHDRDDGRMARVERRLRRKGGLPAGLIERQVEA
jgi:probable rRNA maturation factor